MSAFEPARKSRAAAKRVRLRAPQRGPRMRPVAAAAWLLAILPGCDTVLAATAGTVPPVTEPVHIDGNLDESVWRQALVIREFIQVEPDTGSPASERTELRLLRDDDHLYLGLRAWNSADQVVSARALARDSDFSGDDHITVVLDPFGSGRDGYFFSVNPLGARTDGYIENGAVARPEWDAQWRAEAVRDSGGWSVEMAVAFKDLAFDPARDTWGINVERVMRHRQEVVRWQGAHAGREVYVLGDAAPVEGFTDARQGLGLDVKPFVSIRDGDAGETLEPGLDAVWRITPQLAATLTVNTDFAEAEVDAREVNLTRFPLFFPEKRDFFLQDAAYFEFGGLDHAPFPFFSRRIGLAPDGTPVDLEGGVKLTGREGPWTLGMLHVRQEAGAGLAAESLSVGRAAYRLNEHASIGGLFTDGDPRGPGDNTVYAFDFNYIDSDFRPGQYLTSHLWWQHSDSDAAGGGADAFGALMSYPNEPWGLYLYLGQYDEGFDPALGFVSRTGVREIWPWVLYRWRPEASWIRTFDLSAQTELFLDLDNRLRSNYAQLPEIEVTTQRGDVIELKLRVEREVLEEGFEIVPGVGVDAGSYSYQRLDLEFEADPARRLSGSVFAELGDYFDGRRNDYGFTGALRPSPHLLLEARYELRALRLPGGESDVHIGALRLDLATGPWLSWSTVAQFDSESRELGLNSRLRWTLPPDNDMYLVLDRGYLVDDGRFSTTTRRITLKLGWTFRF